MAYTSFENEEKKEIVDATREGYAQNIYSTALAVCEFSLFSRFFFLPSLFY